MNDDSTPLVSLMHIILVIGNNSFYLNPSHRQSTPPGDVAKHILSVIQPVH